MNATLAPLRRRAFRQLVIGRSFATLANALAPVALSFAVLDLTGSLTALGLVVGVRSLANVASLLFGGVLADRVSRGVILQGTSVASAVSQGLLALAVLAHFASLPLLLALSLVNGVLAALSLPASAALLPETVPEEELLPANAVKRMGSNIAFIAGSSLGGALVASVGSGWAMVLNAVVQLVAAACYLTVRLPVVARPAERTRPIAELREGWREFTANRWVWVVVLQFMVVNAAESGAVTVLGPGVADATVGRAVWGVLLSVPMAGALAAGLLVARLAIRRALLVGVAAVLTMALPSLTLALHPTVPVLAVAMFTTGFAMEFFGVAWDLSLQQNVPADRLARVYSFDALGSFLALPLGEMAAGPLAGRIGTRATLLGATTLILLATAAALVDRSVRSLTVREPAVAAEQPVPA
ncbi:MFS transporter [Kitasatospora viridis]|uniref:Putative MFS family arabinose efflux permease n=1 Tax=Kitasatospora viridis TaxID=281105 RepID=A0A561UDQ9_9ACTN|nr:MFS transporter [Kitasatospora viridis]TWF97486.1 putative MFS family arabinose efflux permease [Kitasatospora viridis]